MTPRIGTPEEFHELREWLDKVGLPDEREQPDHPLVRFFSRSQPRPRSELGQPLLEDLGLAVPADTEGWIRPSVDLYRMAGLYLVSDSFASIQAGMAPFDAVFPPSAFGTRLFMRSLPKEPAPTALDLCAGAAPAALILARAGAREVTATDLSHRAAHFATFNARLNGLPRIESLQGDTFEAVRGRKFHLIAAQPPFIPDFGQKYMFLNSGEIGHTIPQRILSELPEYLEPGGSFHAVLSLFEDASATVSGRIRGWLGEAGDRFDIFVFERLRRNARDAFSMEQGEKEETAAAWQEVCERRGLTDSVLSVIVLQRHASTRPAITASRHVDAPDWERIRDYIALHQDTGIAARLREGKLADAPSLSVLSSSRHEDGREIETVELYTSHPFPDRRALPAELSGLLPLCDGTRSGAEVLAALPQRPEEALFWREVESLVREGFLELRG
ncbi:MAG: methyltransferase [Bryobacteraceae bacterium]|nr:methyltransferase [Bryobacteraceae bacterium]